MSREKLSENKQKRKLSAARNERKKLQRNNVEVKGKLNSDNFLEGGKNWYITVDHNNSTKSAVSMY